VAIEVFAGNTGDPKTVASQADKVKDRSGITQVVLVGDRGMLTAARLREDVAPEGLDWITALRAPQVKKLVRDGDLQLTLFDVQDLAEITSPDFPGERLVACKNPFLQAGRARKRESLLAATEAGLEKIAAACARARRPLRGQGKIALRADRVLNRRKVGKHFTTDIGEDRFSYHRNQDSITAEAALDGIYVLRTSVTAGDLEPGEVVSSYKALAQVERAFRAFNTDLDIRPIRHRTEDRVRAHVFLRMLSYYITWHMQARLAPVLFTDDDKPAAQAARPSPVAPAARSPRALAKAAAKRTDDDLPVHSFGSLLTDLATICLNTIAPADPALPGFRLVTTPPRSSARPSTCSASATILAPRSQQPAPDITKAQVNGLTRGSLGELRSRSTWRSAGQRTRRRHPESDATPARGAMRFGRSCLGPARRRGGSSAWRAGSTGSPGARAVAVVYLGEPLFDRQELAV
jgi:hypothetical protein